ncbi:MAG: hypothetical protein ACLP5V_03910 [Candidatus Bathyarchaeia archaeon]
MPGRSFPNRLPSEGDGSTRRTKTIQLMAELLDDGWHFNALIQQLRFRGFRAQTAREYVETAEEMNKANWKSPSVGKPFEEYVPPPEKKAQ